MKNLKIKLFNFYNTEVYLHLSFLIFFLIIGILPTIILFLSVMIHELSHCYVGIRKGYKCKEIQLGLLFGSAIFDNEKSINDKDDILITLAGPLSNLFLWGLFKMISTIVISNDFLSPFIDQMISFNLVLFIFNMIPVLPMDGGRILKSFLSIKLGIRGVKISSYLSIIVCLLIISLSLYVASHIITFMFIYFLFINAMSIYYNKK